MLDSIRMAIDKAECASALLLFGGEVLCEGLFGDVSRAYFA